MVLISWCGSCAAEVAFAVFDCDDHGADCVELVCCTCGAGYERAGAATEAPTEAAAGEPSIETAA